MLCDTAEFGTLLAVLLFYCPHRIASLKDRHDRFKRRYDKSSATFSFSSDGRSILLSFPVLISICIRLNLLHPVLPLQSTHEIIAIPIMSAQTTASAKRELDTANTQYASYHNQAQALNNQVLARSFTAPERYQPEATGYTVCKRCTHS